MKKRLCQRCGEQFVPDKKLKEFSVSKKYCIQCMVRNIYDVLHMPTPPALLDQHTKHPALTESEYKRKLEEFKP